MKTLFVQPLHFHHVLQAPNNFCGPSLVLLQFVDLSLIQGAPKLDTVFQMCSHIRCAEGNNHLPLTAGYALSYTALYTVGFRCYKGTLLTHVQLVHQHPQVLLCKIAAYSVGPHLHRCVALFLPRYRALYFSVLNPMKFPVTFCLSRSL